MAVSVDSVKLAVNLGYDVAAAEGELARVFCRNTETGGVSNGNWGKNDGFAVVTYPQNYEGVTEIVVQGNHGGTDEGFIEISGGEATVVDPDLSPEHPIEIPPVEEGGGDPNAPHPEHPIVDVDPHPEHPIA